jgi:hypothetical protein
MFFGRAIGGQADQFALHLFQKMRKSLESQASSDRAIKTFTTKPCVVVENEESG